MTKRERKKCVVDVDKMFNDKATLNSSIGEEGNNFEMGLKDMMRAGKRLPESIYCKADP
jgi:hypothetical protein